MRHLNYRCVVNVKESHFVYILGWIIKGEENHSAIAVIVRYFGARFLDNQYIT
jgi:hypothetical protein